MLFGSISGKAGWFRSNRWPAFHLGTIESNATAVVRPTAYGKALGDIAQSAGLQLRQVAIDRAGDAGTRRAMTTQAQERSLKQCRISPIRSSLATSAAGLTFLSSRPP